MNIDTRLEIFYKNRSPYYKEFLDSIEDIDYILINLYNYGIDSNKISGDLDIIIDPKEYQYVKEQLLKLDFIKYIESNTNQIQWIKYIEKIGTVQIHVHLDFYFFDKKIVSFKELEHSKRFLDIHEEYILFCIQTFYKNKYNDKIYKKFLYFKDRIDEIKVNNLIESKYKHVKKFLLFVQQNIEKKYNPSKIDHYKILLKDDFFSIGKIILSKSIKKIIKFFNFNSNDIEVVFIGVDGAGKSTTIYNIEKVLNNEVMYKKYYFGLKTSMINRIRTFFSKKEEKNKDQEIKKEIKNTKNITNISFIKKIYFLAIGTLYWIEYNIKYLILIKSNSITASTIHLIDRNYYDALLYHNLEILDFLFFRCSFKPDIVIYLTGDTNKLYERKKEISKDEINFNKNNYDDIINKLKHHKINTKIIDTTLKSELEVESLICSSIFKLISKKV